MRMMKFTGFLLHVNTEFVNKDSKVFMHVIISVSNVLTNVLIIFKCVAMSDILYLTAQVIRAQTYPKYSYSILLDSAQNSMK